MTDSRGSTSVALSKPRIGTGLSVEQALAQRRSVRTFADRSVSLADLSQLLWAAQGITGHFDKRTAPSAGALHQMSIAVVAADVDALPAGIYRYDPALHDLALLSEGDHRDELRSATDQQEAIGVSPVDLVIAGDARPLVDKYGDRGIRYLHMEAGHIAQNVYLQATALGLATASMGAFDDDAMSQAVRLPSPHRALYVMPIGYA
ncbi:MAG: SagB/ThcOx family dehydrogenase [Gemmatimonadetes bacterium]|jgi:SagB-type dehydrogenase family enzyme|nr:SagB/ThcOx family dehydrogenase [Gemmatimonadota bacterium]MBT5056773.1 SagB/ThcOx family dehydrogenase [Gemmatimonadota bacterium]MBT5146675.1 SagB/ThcOx family dehydrogenase [Gemmatimonadota bacterium]MBT5587898.1 SagB/ThcOx family dehydrogenase [Gemmatimonadota bacterium]MBT5963636.1 SagB/ThcOx family dehydrogenase [Gemmatimonadota bacterium]